MTGSVHENRPGYWQVKVYAGKNAKGQSRYLSRYQAGTREDADRLLRRLLVDIDEGTVDTGRSTKGTVAELIDRYLAHRENLGRRPSTLAGYRAIAKTIKRHLGDLHLAKLRPVEVDEMYGAFARAGMKPPTILNHHRFLSSVLAQGVKWGLIATNPADNATMPKVVRKRHKTPKSTAVIDLLAAAKASRNPELGVAFRLLAATGMRRGELCALRWSDLSGATLTIGRSITVIPGEAPIEGPTKAGNVREVTLDPKTLAALHAHHDDQRATAKALGGKLARNAFILADIANGIDGTVCWKPHRLTQAFVRIARRVGFVGRLHDLRHYHATILLDAGESAPAVAQRLGHTSPTTTMRIYAGVGEHADSRAAAIVGARLAGE